MFRYKFPKLNIPDTWNSVDEFAKWYVENGMPITTKDSEVFCSDDATAICLFRHGQFQVELYLVHPKPLVQIHEHPNVDVIKMSIQGDEAIFEDTLYDGLSHGEGMRREGDLKGFGLFAFQHWKKDKPTTIASAWKGRTVGKMHEEIIKRFKPDALLVEGYADTRRTMKDLEGLLNE